MALVGYGLRVQGTRPPGSTSVLIAAYDQETLLGRSECRAHESLKLVGRNRRTMEY